MAWPLSQDYNEAIQNPLTSFSDAELRQGQVVTNALGIPQPCSGNFADVYAVECTASKTKWAVKCFTREVRGLRERYSAISSYLKQANLPFTVEFQYLEQGIRIAGKWYPVLKMHWVEGFTLNAFVRDNLDMPARLEGLSRIWLKMAARLREANLAHCDLQHGNVLLVPYTDRSLLIKLIDYDGMWVPALAQTPSGEVGHPAYQHPQRLRDGVYNREVDRFPLLAIHLALRALMVGGRPLWERFDTGDNMLFRQQDFETPARSPLFAELLRMKQTEVSDLAGKLIDAARQPLDQVAHLTELVPVESPPPPARSSARREIAPAAPAASVFATATLEPSSADGGRRRQQPSKAGFGLIAAACAAGIVLILGGVLIWAMSSKSPTQKNPATPDPRQARAKHKEPVIPPRDKKSPQPTEKAKPDDPPTPPVKPEPVVVPPAVKPKPEDVPPPTKPKPDNVPPPAKPKPDDVPPSLKPKTEEPLPEKTREIAFLSSFPVLSKKHALDWFTTNGTINSPPVSGKFTVQGKESPHGIFLHPEDNRDAEVSYKLGRKWAIFRCGVAVPRMGDKAEEKGLGSPLTFEVLGDEVNLWTSKAVRDFGQPQWCEVKVEKVDVLRLRVRCPGRASCTRAVWLEPRVMTPADLQDPLTATDSIVVRLPEPNEDVQKKATEDIREIYQDDYKNAAPDELSRKLLKRGQSRQEETGRRFVYFREARDLAAQAGDFALCYKAIEEMTSAFAVETWAMKMDAIQTAAKVASTQSANKAVLETALALLTEAIQSDDYDAAEQIAKATEAVVKKAGASAKVIQPLTTEVKRLKTKYEEIKPAVARLSQDAKDAEANRIVGSFRCFEKADWKRGLPLLALGDDANLKALAEKDRDAGATFEARMAVGDGWWTLAQPKARGSAKAIVQQRACEWYAQALPDALKKDRDRMEKNVRRYHTDYPARAWGHLDFTQAKVAFGSLHVPKGEKEISTLEPYSGPIEITVLARTSKNNIRLHWTKGSGVIFNWENNTSELRVIRPDGNDNIESGSVVPAPVKPLQPNNWYLLSWRVTEEGMSVSENGRVVFTEQHKNNLSVKHPVRVHACDSDIEVMSFTVRPIAKK